MATYRQKAIPQGGDPPPPKKRTQSPMTVLSQCFEAVHKSEAAFRDRRRRMMDELQHLLNDAKEHRRTLAGLGECGDAPQDVRVEARGAAAEAQVRVDLLLLVLTCVYQKGDEGHQTRIEGLLANCRREISELVSDPERMHAALDDLVRERTVDVLSGEGD